MRSVAALLLLGLAAPAHAQLTVTYIANEGFLLEGGERKVLVDALFGPGISPYPTIPPALRPALEGASPPFDDVDVVLATHHHADHFDAGTVARHLRANPGARFISTPQAVDRLRRVAADDPGVLERLDATLPPEGERRTVRHRGLDVVVLNLHHGRSRNPPVQNLGFLVVMGGVKWLHVGDTEVDEDDVRPYALPSEAIGVALLPTWFFGSERWVRVVERHIRPANVVVMHRVNERAPASYYEPGASATSQTRRIRQRFPGAVIPGEPGESKTFTRREGEGG